MEPINIQNLLNLSNDSMSRFRALRWDPQTPRPLLPDANEAEQLLVQLGVEDRDRSDIIAARPEPVGDAECLWIIDRVFQDILSRMGSPVSVEGFSGYPALPAESGAVGRHLPVWTFLALIPHVRQLHTERSIPDTVSWESLGMAMTSALQGHRAMMGESGLGLWGFGRTLPLRFRGVDYQLGRLGFHIGELSLSGGVCGYVLGVHILGKERLDVAACRASIKQAREFFPRHFPEKPISFITCASWLMDPQLTDYLDSDSNIVQFQHMFEILPLPDARTSSSRSDDDILGYVFDKPADTTTPVAERLDSLPQTTRLQRAYVQHLRAGHHWHSRTGWFPFAVQEQPRENQID